MGRLVVALVLAALAAGCAFGGSERDGMDETYATLAQRPAIENIQVTYKQRRAQLRDRLSAEVGPMQWVNDQNFSGAGCGDGVDGQSLILDSWTSQGSLPDARWGDAVRIVAEVTGEYGFGPTQTVVDRPGDHEITATGPYGAKYLFGTAANMVLLVNTGCHLPANAHPGA